MTLKLTSSTLSRDLTVDCVTEHTEVHNTESEKWLVWALPKCRRKWTVRSVCWHCGVYGHMPLCMCVCWGGGSSSCGDDALLGALPCRLETWCTNLLHSPLRTGKTKNVIMQLRLLVCWDAVHFHPRSASGKRLSAAQWHILPLLAKSFSHSDTCFFNNL